MRRRRLPALAACLCLCLAAAARADDPAQLVDPFVGTESGAPDFGTGGGAGATFPGPALPSGMVQFSPDTAPSLDNFAGGYSYEDHMLRGFSLTHFSGAGCALLGDVPILPFPGAVTLSPARAGVSDITPRYLAPFSHRHEHAAPGGYSVTLDPNSSRATVAELTATARTGDARFTFPHGRATVLVNAGGSSLADYAADLAVDPAHREISGSVTSGAFCYTPTRYRVYFAAQFSRPFASSGVWHDRSVRRGGRRVAAANPNAFTLKGVAGVPTPPVGNPNSGVQVGAYASFDTRRARQVEVRVGVSFTSAAAARGNLRAESAGRSFSALHRAAVATWRSSLSAVTVRGGSRARRAMLATSLYHALLEPSTISDASGTYPGMDGRAHASRVPQLSDISGWDIYRTQVPLLAMLDPARTASLATSLLRDAEQGGCLPRWPYANQQTNVMVGDPSAQMLAGAYAFGVRGFDAGEALRRSVAGAETTCRSPSGDYTEREGLRDLRRLGYIPYEDNTDSVSHSLSARGAPWGTVSTTLEDAAADGAIARLAQSLHRPSIARRFASYAGRWRNLLDRGTDLMRPRLRSGAWVSPFGPTTTAGYVEGNASQYTWFVPQAPAALIDALGGPGAAVRRLNRFFTRINAGQAAPYAFLGNEPTLGTPWLYDWLGRPDLASSVVHRALSGLYGLRPGGMPGNDDGGALSAWWVLGAVGLYPAVPGSDTLAISAPLFPDISLRFAAGSLRIRALGLSSGRMQITAASLDGRPLTRSRISFAAIAHGHHVLRFRMGAHGRWASRPG